MENKIAFVIIISILLILLLASVGYILGLKWNQSKQEYYQQGIDDGYQQTIIQIAQQAATCRQIPLTVGNQTINVVAVECLR